MASAQRASHATPLPAQAPERTRIVIADDDPVARCRIGEALGEAGRVVDVAQASDGVEAVELALHYRPQLLVAETAMPPALKMQALLAGARGFLSRDLPLDKVVQTLAGLRPGEAVVSTGVTAELVRSWPCPRRGTACGRSSAS